MRVCHCLIKFIYNLLEFLSFTMFMCHTRHQPDGVSICTGKLHNFLMKLSIIGHYKLFEEIVWKLIIFASLCLNIHWDLTFLWLNYVSKRAWERVYVTEFNEVRTRPMSKFLNRLPFIMSVREILNEKVIFLMSESRKHQIKVMILTSVEYKTVCFMYEKPFFVM